MKKKLNLCMKQTEKLQKAKLNEKFTRKKK